MRVSKSIATFIPKELDFFSYAKIWLLVMFSLPFWGVPLFLAFILKAVAFEQNHDKWSFYFSVVPVLYAYGTMLMGFLRIQRDKVKGKLKAISFIGVLSNHAQSLLKLLLLQGAEILLNKFSGDSLVFLVILQLYYFFSEITEYWYRRILSTIPVNQRMLQTFGDHSVLVSLLKL